jgi:hypothetical protein
MSNRSEDERLEALRAADNWRQWQSLDDERLCIECMHLISGREITITDNGNDQPILRCPTPACNAGPRDWFYHGTRNQHVLAKAGQVV